MEKRFIVCSYEKFKQEVDYLQLNVLAWAIGEIDDDEFLNVTQTSLFSGACLECYGGESLGDKFNALALQREMNWTLRLTKHVRSEILLASLEAPHPV